MSDATPRRAPRPSARRPWPWRRRLVAAAIAGSTLLALGAASHLAWSWHARRAATMAALHEHLVFTAYVVGDEILRTSAERRWRLLSPVLGLSADDLADDSTLRAFATHVDTTLDAWGIHADSIRGVFRMRLDARPGAPLQVLNAIGAVRDSAWQRATVAAVESRVRGRDDVNAGEPLLAFLTRDGRQLGNVVFLRTRSARRAQRAPTTLVGVTYDRARSTESITEVARHAIPPLPPALSAGLGVSSGSARLARRVDSGWPESGAVTNDRSVERALVGTRFLTRSGELLYSSAGWPYLRWNTPHRARVTYDSRPGGFELEMAIDGATGNRLVAAAVPVSEVWLVFALSVLALVLAAGGVVGFRRERAIERTRARFLASVSHELRTPLAQICIFSDTLLQDADELSPQTARWLGIINREAHRLGLMVERVLLWARDEGGKLDIERRPCDALDIAEDVQVAMGPVAASRRSRIAVEGPATCPVDVDPNAYRQVLLNLVDNAIKYGPADGTVTVTLRAPDERGVFVTTVDDEGEGIPDAMRARVWRPYERLEQHDDTTGGSGLGLSVVRTLVRQHGGSVAIESAPGGGARFVIAIPVRARAAAALGHLHHAEASA